MSEGENLPAESAETAVASAPIKPAAPLRAVGDTVAGRFKIEEIMPQLGVYPHYRVQDTQNSNARVVLSEIGTPNKAEPDKVKRGLERATRAMSWIRHPGFLLPKEFIQDNGVLYSVFPDPKGVLLDDYIRSNNPPLSKKVYWVNELAAMLDQIHEARQPQFVGRMPIRNVVVNADGEVQLLGFDLNRDFKLEFFAADDTAPQPPDAKVDARTDVWVLGKLLQQMVEVGGDESKKAYKEEPDLRNLVQIMVANEPEKRVSNMSTLKSRLERMRWKDAPKPAAASLLDAPITELTVEVVDPNKKFKEQIRVGMLVALMVIVLVMLLGQVMFPNGGDY